MKKTKGVAIISISINLILGFLIMYKLGIPYINNKLNPNSVMTSGDYYYLAKSGLLEELDISKQDIVFLGDSLTDRNEWQEYFKNNSIKNRGIDGDTTCKLLERLGSITKGKPSKMFIMVGTNDLNNGKSIEYIVDNYNKIIKEIKSDSPETKIYIQSVLPVNEEMNRSNRKNKDIFLLNSKIREVADSYSVQYIDLIPHLSKNNELIKEFTIDGVHLKSDGYQMWTKAIGKYVTQ
ncbi:GDSL-type esterase/lipase family protein [Clostridium sp. BSD9I1]|uniref:GDSL-type esterase/lipase family protein n=1 Tax=Clostridium sp. BSD9I1 TaxID=2003589 RepID=UPI0016478FCF|nr:GDSL-type esterase/lipase family protein [Clostridium sp. BSD9I1]